MFDFKQKRNQLIELLKKEGINDGCVLEAMLKVERHLFVDKIFEEYAYDNRPLPIGHFQTISQPYIVAYMTSEASVSSTSGVLEIGTGSGYQTAILAEICQEVFTIERIEELSKQAQVLLNWLGYKNIYFKVGDGYDGWETAAPFDAIIVTAKAEALPERFIQQLVVGGRLIIPLQKDHERQLLVKLTKKSLANDYSTEDLLDVRFVPMV